jgi:hypothetical protein
MRIISIYVFIIDGDGTVQDELFAHSANPVDLAMFVSDVLDVDYGQDISWEKLAKDLNDCWNATETDTLCDRRIQYYEDPQKYPYQVNMRVHCSYI